MFRAKTVFVIGAGASVEVGLPMGTELLKQIVKLTHITFEHSRHKDGDGAILEALKIILNEGGDVKQLNLHLKAAWQLGESAKQALSIDNVIDALEDDKIELVGKLGIVRAIHKAEAASSFFKPPEPHQDALNLQKFDDTWYSAFTKLLTENVRKSGLDEIFSNIEIINFNYDRCLEHYLPYSLGNYYGVGPAAIRKIMSSLVVHRPYGIAGRLPWQPGETPGVQFGGSDAKDLAEVVQQVRTFTERIEEGAELTALKDSLSAADRIVFLGFAFHRQNVALLAQHGQPHAEVLATAFGISKSDTSVIETEIEKAFEFGGFDQYQTVLADMKCHQFFSEYWRTLTAEKSDRVPIDGTIGAY